jgi:putative phosphoribosyl transferase
VKAPTLFIVGGNDQVVVDLNERALANMSPDGQKKLVVVPGASHLFEEAGALEHAARLACDWFQTHLDGVGLRE